MIPSIRDLIAAHAFLSRRLGGEAPSYDDEPIELLVEARVEAQRLAMGGDPLAALFFAFAKRSPSLGEDFIMALILVTLNHGRTLGRRPIGDPRVDSRALLVAAREIGAGVTTFSAFCTWLSERMPS